MGYLELGYLEHPAVSNYFSLPLAQINPGYLEKLSQEVQSRHLLTRCTESWEMHWRVHGNYESKVRLGLAVANAEGDKLPVC